MTDVILAHGQWKTNAELIVSCRDLGYLSDDWTTWDATYGLGTFWKLWRPKNLIGTDIDPSLSAGVPVDFTASGWASKSFDSVVFDPPYKLNGTPTDAIDGRYGVHLVRTWQQRMALIEAGTTECARVLGAGYLLVKCQDQVCRNQKRWQTDLVTAAATKAGLRKVDRLDMPSYRKQPPDRPQRHAHSNTSQLLIFNRSR